MSKKAFLPWHQTVVCHYLARLVSISTERIKNRLELLHSVLDIPTDATRPVIIFHGSVRDFLIRPDPADVHEFVTDQKVTHKKLADRFLQLLSEDGYLMKDICGLGAPGKSRTTVDPETIEQCLPSEAQYACLYWKHHLKSSRVTLDDENQALRFFRSHFIHWLEALSLTGRISESIKLINELKGLVGVSHFYNYTDIFPQVLIFIGRLQFCSV
jgi:hypothetical protein